jgi:lipopolysaccharide transport system ATP-binding protein
VIAFENVTMIYQLDAWFRAGIKNAILRGGPWGQGNGRPRAVTALHNVSFHIERGEKFAIIGQNGSGKSTTLGLIAGVLRPTVGKVTVRGRISPLLELGAGFNAELSGRDNIVLNGILLGMTRRVVMSKIEEIIEFSGIREYIDNPLRTYSSGMMARLGFSVVVHLDPEILLIDEVLAVGDAEFARKCTAMIDKFRNSETTIVLVTHDMASAQRLCQRAAVLQHGALRFVGPSADAVSAYTGNVGAPSAG